MNSIDPMSIQDVTVDILCVILTPWDSPDFKILEQVLTQVRVTKIILITTNQIPLNNFPNNRDSYVGSAQNNTS